MLNERLASNSSLRSRAGQRGVALLITLIVLVAITLAAIAMIRSVDTGNVIAGNLSFRQAATNSGDLGIEAAIAWLAKNRSAGTYLYIDHNSPTDPMGYSSNHSATPVPGQSWDDYWNNVLVPNNQVVRVKFNASGAPDPAGTNLRDNADNAVYYTIARLCNTNGDPTIPGTGCNISPVNATLNNASNQGAGTIYLEYYPQIYYRITSRVVGPRNTVSYVQAIVTSN